MKIVLLSLELWHDLMKFLGVLYSLKNWRLDGTYDFIDVEIS